MFADSTLGCGRGAQFKRYGLPGVSGTAGMILGIGKPRQLARRGPGGARLALTLYGSFTQPTRASLDPDLAAQGQSGPTGEVLVIGR